MSGGLCLRVGRHDEVRSKYTLLVTNLLRYLTGCLCYSSHSHAVFPGGSFLLDVRRGNLLLLACCSGLQHRKQDAHLSRDVVG